MNILLTGGLGYIGSQAALTFTDSGHEVYIFDNLVNSSFNTVSRIEKIIGKRINFIRGDIRNTDLLLEILIDKKIDVVVHMAGLKSVEESSNNPIEYYSNNVHGSISLLHAMQLANVKKMVFSSSATVYGNPNYLPLDEGHPILPVNPYGRNKAQIEEMLTDLSLSDSDWSIVCLRYFNPVGAHESGLIGENPSGIPNNLMPYVSQVAAGRLPLLSIYGDDYETIDGTGVRDYVHVVDLAEAHLAAFNYINSNSNKGINFFNLGVGHGYSVLEMVNSFERISGQKINFNVVSRRVGDIPICYADPSKAEKILGWKAKLSLDDMCESLWRWEKNI